MIGEDFHIRCSAIHRIMAEMKPAGLTEAEKKELDTLYRCEAGQLLTLSGKVATFTPKRAERLKELQELKADPRQPELPAGAKTYCNEWLQNAMYKRSSHFTAKQTEKGTRTEDDGIDLLREYLQDPFVPNKNEWRVVGEYIEGECDLHYLPMVYDIKSSYTHAGMDLYATEAERAHYCQLQGYGHLFGAKSLGLTRVLCNMPDDMIQREAYFATKAKHGPDYTEAQLEAEVERLTRRYTYDDLPIEMRVHTVTFDFDPAFIEQVIERVKMCRAYINERFAALPADKRNAVEGYVAERKRKAHHADVKRTEVRAKEWRANNCINQPETAQTVEV